MRITLVISLISFVCLSTSCKKKGNTTEPEVPSVITITTPTAGTVYINGSGLRVTGNMTDDNVLSVAKVEIRNKVSGTVYNTQSSTTGNVGYFGFDWAWTVTGITTTTQATVKVTAKDKLGNEVYTEVDVTLDN